MCSTTRCSNLEEAGVYYKIADTVTRQECMFNLSTCICMLQEEPKTPCGTTAYNISVFLVFENAVNVSINYSSTPNNTNLRVMTSSVGKNSNCTISNGTIMDCITPLTIDFKNQQFDLSQLFNDTCCKLCAYL